MKCNNGRNKADPTAISHYYDVVNSGNAVARTSLLRSYNIMQAFTQQGAGSQKLDVRHVLSANNMSADHEDTTTWCVCDALFLHKSLIFTKSQVHDKVGRGKYKVLLRQYFTNTKVRFFYPSTFVRS